MGKSRKKSSERLWHRVKKNILKKRKELSNSTLLHVCMVAHSQILLSVQQIENCLENGLVDWHHLAY